MAAFSIVSAVSAIEANRLVKDQLMERLRRQSRRRRISVTDLLSLKQAYYRRKHPDIVPPLERQQIMWSGTGFHQLFGAAVSSEEYLEQFVEVDGVVGKIDIFEDVPTEVKTTSSLVAEDNMVLKRPSYLEQLGFYCGMAGASEGRIIIYQRGAPAGESLGAFYVRFDNTANVMDELRRRRDLLVDAIDRDDPSRLPVCSWANWQCDYAAVCDCRESRVAASRAVLDEVKSVEPDVVGARRLTLRLGQFPERKRRVRLYDLVFPRKTYFNRLKAEARRDAEADVDEEAAERLASMDRMGLLGVVREAVKYGAPGESQQVPIAAGPLDDMILISQGLPTVVRDPAFRSPAERSSLPRVFGHYFWRLGFECALAGHSRGRLVLYYKNVPRDDAKLMVYDVGFRDIAALKAEALRRASLLGSAHRATELPPCPPWMCKSCDSRAACGGEVFDTF